MAIICNSTPIPIFIMCLATDKRDSYILDLGVNLLREKEERSAKGRLPSAICVSAFPRDGPF